MTTLQELKDAWMEAQRHYYLHPTPSSKTTIEQDIENQRLMSAAADTKYAYEQALKKANEANNG